MIVILNLHGKNTRIGAKHSTRLLQTIASKNVWLQVPDIRTVTGNIAVVPVLDCANSKDLCPRGSAAILAAHNVIRNEIEQQFALAAARTLSCDLLFAPIDAIPCVNLFTKCINFIHMFMGNNAHAEVIEAKRIRSIFAAFN